ncbi:ankyrin repeat [Fusarium coicis]|nr:ankyrin repeat [Fusarium coicis]
MSSSARLSTSSSGQNGHRAPFSLRRFAGQLGFSRVLQQGSTPLGSFQAPGRVHKATLTAWRSGQCQGYDDRDRIVPFCWRGALGCCQVASRAWRSTELTPSREEAPLSLVAQRGHVDVVRLLLAYGANIDAKNLDGKTALDVVQGEYTKRITFDEVVEVLKSH